jgi:hypothetical protein
LDNFHSFEVFAKFNELVFNFDKKNFRTKSNVEDIPSCEAQSLEILFVPLYYLDKNKK